MALATGGLSRGKPTGTVEASEEAAPVLASLFADPFPGIDEERLGNFGSSKESDLKVGPHLGTFGGGGRPPPDLEIAGGGGSPEPDFALAFAFASGFGTALESAFGAEDLGSPAGAPLRLGGIATSNQLT